jgi:CxxC-x17-CxxC domain-containing protein
LDPAQTRPKKPKPERPKFDVTCQECGTAAQVPFKPIEGRDVFCQPCYRARRGIVAPTTEPNLSTESADEAPSVDGATDVPDERSSVVTD